MDAWGMEVEWTGLDGPEGMTFALHGWEGFDTKWGGACHGICTCGPGRVGSDAHALSACRRRIRPAIMELRRLGLDVRRCCFTDKCMQVFSRILPNWRGNGRAKLFSIG
jgi:hypothetical protein